MASLEKPLGPGQYLPDPTEGLVNPQDLPRPIVLRRSRNYRHRRCPGCGQSAYRLRTACRQLHDLGDPRRGRPCELHLCYSQHHCRHCGRYFNAPMQDLAAPGSHYTHRVLRTAVRLVVEDGLPYRSASWHLWRDHRVFVPFVTIQNSGGGRGGKRRWPPAGSSRKRPCGSSPAIWRWTRCTTGPSRC